MTTMTGYTLHRKGKPTVTGDLVFACPTHVVMVVRGKECTFIFRPERGDRLTREESK